MKAIPYQKIVFHTKLKEKEILKRLRSITEPSAYGFDFLFWFSTNRKLKPYTGTIEENKFKINRILSFGNQNSFSPVFIGLIEQNNIEITIRMRWHVYIFIMIFYAFCIFFLVFVLFNLFELGLKLESLFLLFFLIPPIGFIAFIYFLTRYGFNREAEKSKKDFQELLEAEIIEKV